MTPSKAPLPFLGTWKLTKCESSRPDLPHPTSSITTFTLKDDAIHYTSDGVWSDGRASKVIAVIPMDGSWCPVSGSMLADSLSLQIEGSSIAGKMRKAGVDVGTTRSTASADGRTMVGRWELVGPGGVTVIWDTASARQ